VKLRDSGMPDEPYWESLFNVPLVLDALGITDSLGDVAEMGCGFGTFSIPVAQRVRGTLFAFDIDPTMVARTTERAQAEGLTNVVCRHRDVMLEGFGLPVGSIDAALLFNILHCEFPEILLDHAAHAVRPEGHVLVIHWRYDSRTPRGPDLATRPKPEQIIKWADATSILQAAGGPIDVPPWHYGLRLTRHT
jgi:SAM-dependent methyltransferase